MIKLEVGQVAKIGEFYLARVEEKDQIYQLNKILTAPESTPEYLAFLVQGLQPGVTYVGPITPGTALPAEAYMEFKHLFFGVFLDPGNHANWLQNAGIGGFTGSEVRVFIPAQDTHQQEGPTIVAEAPFVYKDKVTEVEIAAGQYVVVFDRLFVAKRASTEDDPLKANIVELASKYETPANASKLNTTNLGIGLGQEKI